MKTDILIEPEVMGSEQLYKEIYIVIHTAYIVYIPCSSSVVVFIRDLVNM